MSMGQCAFCSGPQEMPVVEEAKGFKGEQGWAEWAKCQWCGIKENYSHIFNTEQELRESLDIPIDPEEHDYLRNM